MTNHLMRRQRENLEEEPVDSDHVADQEKR
jgi:hypothetical protein